MNRHWTLSILAAIAVVSFQSCEKWGKLDPPAADQKTPRLEQVAKITFEDEEFDPQSLDYYAYEGGNLAAVAEDEEQGKVLHLPDGYARMTNPLAGGSVQNGVSLTFFLRQAVRMDEESGEALPPDLDGAIFSMRNSNETQRMYLTANGTLLYEGVDGRYTSGADVTTGMMTPAGEWHYVALTVRDDGYSVFVNGNERINRHVPRSEFDFGKIVQFMGDALHLYVGYGADVNTREMWIDDITLFRNQITAREQADPRAGGAEFFYERFVTIGATDNSTGWWGDFSPYMPIVGDDTLTFEFQNNGSGANNWNNWVLVVTNEAERGGDGYVEYLVLRSDLYGWASLYDAANLTSEGYPANDDEWAQFREAMKSATVKITITRTGNRFTVNAVSTCSNGKVYTESITCQGSLAPNLNAFLVVDGSHLILDRTTVFSTKRFNPGEISVGAADFSTGWWAEFSPYYTLNGNGTMKLGLQNYGSGANNWNNWVLVVTNEAERGGDGYVEYLVLRSDLYGWASLYNAANLTSEGYPANDDEWAQFREAMKDAAVDITITRTDNRFTVTAVSTCSNGKVYTESITCQGTLSENLNAFVLVDGSRLEMRSVYPSLLWTPIKE